MAGSKRPGRHGGFRSSSRCSARLGHPDDGRTAGTPSHGREPQGPAGASPGEEQAGGGGTHCGTGPAAASPRRRPQAARGGTPPGLAGAPGRCSGRLAGSISRPATWATGDGGPASAAALQGAVHREGGDVCEAAAGARPAAPPDSGRRSRSGSFSGPDGTPGTTRQGEVCRHGPSARGSPDDSRRAAHSGRGEAGGLAPGRGAVRVRGGIRAPLQRDRLPGVPSLDAARSRWRVHGRQYPTALPRA